MKTKEEMLRWLETRIRFVQEVNSKFDTTYRSAGVIRAYREIRKLIESKCHTRLPFKDRIIYDNGDNKSDLIAQAKELSWIIKENLVDWLNAKIMSKEYEGFDSGNTFLKNI